MDYLLDKYREHWAPLIEPDDCKYDEDDLGEKTFKTKSAAKIKREDFSLLNRKG